MPPLALLALGAAVGSYGTAIGAGGGFLLVPLLLFLYPTESVTGLTSLSLAVVALNAFSGALTYARRGRIRYSLGLLLAAVSVPATMAGAGLTRFVARGLFDAAFGVTLLLLAFLLFTRPSARDASAGVARGPGGLTDARPRNVGMGVALSALIGGLSGIMGIGGSPLQVVVLTHLMRVPIHTAMPTAQFMVLLSALGGVAVHLAGGHFDADLTRLALLGAGVLVGAQMGAALSERIPAVGLVRLLAAALLTVGLRLVLKAV